MKAAYYGMVSQIDWQVGLILDRLQEKGLDQNTIVVFLSDHGEFLGDHGIPAKAPFLLDCMLHVPCFIHVPGKDGQDCDALTESIDLYPTLCRLAGIEPPECVQGRDMTPLLEGESTFRDLVFAEAVDKRCIRTDRWKYIHYPGSPRGELYDIVADPHELNNLWDDDVETQNELRERFYAHLDSTEDFRHPSYQRYTGTDPATGQSVTHYLTW